LEVPRPAVGGDMEPLDHRPGWLGRRDLNPRPARAPALAAQAFPVGAPNFGTILAPLRKDVLRIHDPLLRVRDKREKYICITFNHEG
jgi:hypothetical protein